MTKYQQLEKTDRLIVDLLRTDGRMAYRELARRLGVSEGMVRKRVKRLLDAGWLRILAVADPLEMGVPVLATTYAKVSPQHLERITDRLAGCDTVRYVAIGVGSHNLVVESLHKTNAELHDFIQRELGLEGIISSETIQVVKIKKSVWDWPVQVDADAHESKHAIHKGAAV
ncbi:MAG: Lrp/AsnC family transcriptional regulator [Deinococcota bacterium]|jgi:Lrp/AsnC family transcriptional regulator for asnA, asnC and gidA|nr:Lrp/AsnC family transcriptional regulator [Deinococcota bacterium]